MLVNQKNLIKWARDEVTWAAEQGVSTLDELIDGLGDLRNEALALYEEQALAIAWNQKYG